MKTLKIGINGMGRIGRTITRALIQRHMAGVDTHIQLGGFNNMHGTTIAAHLLKYDSIQGNLPIDMVVENDRLLFGKDRYPAFCFQERDPSKIDWSAYDVDIVIDATGVFKDKEGLGKHLGGSVKKVIMCAPGNDLDGTFVMGINNEEYNPETDHIISNASCTTNCLAPIAKVLHENFEIDNGFMTTVHAYTSDQNILDGNHKDLRRARAAATNMIPTSTGAAKALGTVIPELKGKLDGYAVRVPVPNVSMVDLTVNLKKNVSIEAINKAMIEAAEGELKGILSYATEELVSYDFLGNTHSSIFDVPLTNVIGNTAKVVSWYDNEVGFSNRILDLASFIGAKL
jgi:glyceraldehyde 3-phosphate dehydrogenase